MFAITTLFVRPSGEIAKEEGTLFSLPPELRTARRLEAYSKVSLGWSKDDLGYWSYACRSWDGDKVVVPGLIINGERGRKKIYGYSVSFDRHNIENFAHGIIESLDFAYQKASENINLLIHDLRRLSGGMYNAAKEAEYLVDRNADYGDIKSRIINVINFQSMIKIRTDVLDFTGNHASVVNEDEINFFRKIDKVCRCFKSMAARKNIDIDLTGSSFSTVLGPDILEVVPYFIIDNAIKYSPENEKVKIEIYEVGGMIDCYFQSLGPKIEGPEKDYIFEKGVRGEAALRSGVEGSGFGLHLVSEIVRKHFKGSIEVEQNGLVSSYIGAEPMFRTTFKVSMPISC